MLKESRKQNEVVIKFSSPDGKRLTMQSGVANSQYPAAGHIGHLPTENVEWVGGALWKALNMLLSTRKKIGSCGE
jgi:hypothetical protein